MSRLVHLPSPNDAEFAMLCASGQVGGWTALDVAEKVLSKRWAVYGYGGGVVAVSSSPPLLMVEALSIPNFGAKMRGFRDVMDRLAAHYKCDTVETMCFDSRLARAMVHIRAEPVAWLMRWKVEGDG